MKIRPLVAVLAVAVAGVAVPQLYADEPSCVSPPGWTVRYWVHETPTDPNSPVKFKYELTLAAVASDCATTGWAITSLEIRQVGPSDGAERVWTVLDPPVLSSDGLWWVSHSDVSHPQSSEFVLPPGLVGIAAADNPNDPDLEFFLEGVPGDPHAQPAHGVMGLLNQELRPVGDNEVVSADSGVPVEVDPPLGN